MKFHVFFLLSMIFFSLEVEHNSVTCYGFRYCMQMYWSKQEVDCSGWMLKNVSWALVDLPGFTISLNLSRNKISQLKERQFEQLPKLEKLILQRNSLKTVIPGAFKGLGNLTLLDLSSNSIGNLSIGSFKGLKKLITLNLENNCLCCIIKGVFLHSFSLQNLILSRNKLSNVANVFQALKGLSTLDSLDLSQNEITNFSVEVEVKVKCLILCRNNITKLEFSSRFFPYVQKFDFSHNKIDHMSDDLFLNFTNLKYLVFNNNPLNISVLKYSGLLRLDELYVSDLAIRSSSLSELCDFSRRVKLRKLIANYNQITTIESDKLTNCSHLKSLSISDNCIKSLVGEEFKHVINVQDLYLGFNRIIRITNTTWQNLKNLRKLRVNGNDFEVVEYLFSPLSRLESLDLGKNKISNIPTTAFFNLKNLKYLNLDYNQIHDINGACFKDLKSLKTLSFVGNNIYRIKRSFFIPLANLTALSLQSNKVLDIEPFAFKNLPNLRQLSLAVNLIKEVRPNMFQGLDSLQSLNLGKNKISFNSPAALKQPPFTHLRNLERLNLQSQQPHGINYVPNNLFQGLQKLKRLTIKNNPDKHLGEQAFWSLVNLEVLDLSYSSTVSMKGLPRNLFQNLTKLELLFLKSMQLSNLPQQIFNDLTSLRVLSMKSNNFQNISESIIRPLKSLETLNIKFNPLSCSCLNFWFQNWSKINKKTEVSYLKAIPCYVNFQKRQQKFVNFDLSMCLYHNGIVYFLTTAVVLTFLIIIPIIHHKGRWYFLYGWYFVQAWVHERRTDRTREERYQYDAFVSYSSNDEQWVFNELLENLERANPPHFKLCLHHRDFEVGKFIVDNIADSIRNSRKTICVVSRNFLQSEWCNMELQLAGYRLFEEHCDVLILIFLEEIQSHELSNYHQLRKFMRSRTYINWPPYDIGAQKLFWMKELMKDGVSIHGVSSEEECMRVVCGDHQKSFIFVHNA